MIYCYENFAKVIVVLTYIVLVTACTGHIVDSQINMIIDGTDNGVYYTALQPAM
jgi:hypothetical protein